MATMMEETSGDHFWTSECQAPVELSSRQQAILMCSSCGKPELKMKSRRPTW